MNDSIAPRAIYRNHQDTVVANVDPPYHSREEETQEVRLSHTSNFTPISHTSPLSSASPFTRDTSPTTQEIGQHADPDWNPHLPAMALRPTPARSDADPSRNSSVEPAVGEMDEALGFRNTGLPPEVQQAMRLLVRKIRLSAFFTNGELEPILGGPFDASALMAVVSSDLWTGYGTKGQSIYSLFIKMDGEDYTCLWCGDVQHAKPLRALGHFRKKHLRHKPFTCGSVHADENVW